MAPTGLPDELAAVARQFVEFAAHCEGVAPLYALVSLRIAGDPQLLELAAQTQPGQPGPNMLFAAVHDRLLAAPDHPLARYYPSVGGAAVPDQATFELFRAFCLAHASLLTGLIRTRITQTNEVQRCVYLLPGLALVQQLAGGRPLALIELGPSAGLNLNLDRYGYRYSSGQVCGDLQGPVQLAGVLRGATRPPIPSHPPLIVWRAGIERHPIDLSDPHARRWLEALAWPEQPDRLARLRAAIGMALHEPPPIVHADLLTDLEPLLATAPSDAAVCVVHTHVLYQLDPAQRRSVDNILGAAAAGRPIYRLGCEHSGATFPDLLLDIYNQRDRRTYLLARTTGHANWIEWQAVDF